MQSLKSCVLFEEGISFFFFLFYLNLSIRILIFLYLSDMMETEYDPDDEILLLIYRQLREKAG